MDDQSSQRTTPNDRVRPRIDWRAAVILGWMTLVAVLYAHAMIQARPAAWQAVTRWITRR